MQYIRKFVSSLLLFLVISTIPLLILQRQNISDWWRLRDYRPSAEIVALADNASMNDLARKLFYVNHPELNSAAEFNENCSGFEQTIVLGCYVSGQGIYIYNVDDDRLDGIHEVTAAHEMLHVAYERLSGEARYDIDQLTKTAFEKLSDKRVKKVIESYKNEDASVVANELHSILATEVSELPDSLEEYYSKYFIDRQVVIKLAKSYDKAFSDRQAKIASLAKQIDVLEKSLRLQRVALNRQLKDINSDSAELERLKNEGKTEEYNSKVPPYNLKIQEYRHRVELFNADVMRMNKMIKQHNQLAIEQRDLANAIDSQNGL